MDSSITLLVISSLHISRIIPMYLYLCREITVWKVNQFEHMLYVCLYKQLCKAINFISMFSIWFLNVLRKWKYHKWLQVKPVFWDEGILLGYNYIIVKRSFCLINFLRYVVKWTNEWTLIRDMWPNFCVYHLVML